MANGNNFFAEISLASIIENIIATAIVTASIFIVRWLLKELENRTAFGRRHRVAITLVRHGFYWLIAIGVCLYWSYLFPTQKWYVVFASIVMLVAINFLKIYQLTKFKYAGIEAIDAKIKSGIDYKKSLKMCHGGLEFLGVGASKLTELDEFEQAVHRCHINRKPVRLLLSTPDNPLINRAARQANEHEDTFSNRVKQSLQRIKQIQERGDYNIEVKFYPEEHQKDLQQFRLMFLNDSLCLVSYTAWGKRNEDGSNLPQLRIRNDISADAFQTFYYPFKQHFDRLWDESTPWDFTSYLD